MGKSSTPTAAAGVDLPVYNRAQIPAPSDWKNRQIVIVEAAGTSAVWFSNGVTWAQSGGTGTGVTAATAAEVAAFALAGTLTAGGIYFDSATGLHYLASSTTAYGPLSASLHQGTMTLATALAIAAPVAGYTADITDILPSGEPIRIRYNGTAWKALAQARHRLRALGGAGTAAQYPTSLRWALPTGAMALFSAFNIAWRFDISNELDTLNSWRLKLGTVGDATDATILDNGTGTPMSAADNQRAWRQEWQIESTTTVRADGLSDLPGAGFTGSVATTVPDGAITLAAGTTASALYLGIDYTQTTNANVTSVSMIYTLLP